MNFDHQWLGRISYQEGLDHQDKWAKQANDTNMILSCEHPSVVTLGKRASGLKEFVAPPDELRAKGFEVHEVDRGGHAVVHNPGQLVIYPILDLTRNNLTVKTYVKKLEEATLGFLQSFDIDVTRAVEPGLWVDDKKIAYFGIRVRHGITTHGLAINITNELLPFTQIRQCGRCTQATNLEQEIKMPPPTMEALAQKWAQYFKES